MPSPLTGHLHGTFAGCRTIRQLASGGMAQVHEAFDLGTGEQLALKLVFRQAGQDARAALAAEREGAILQQRLGSIDPRVARILRYGDEGEYFYVQMEFVEGEDLSHLVERGPLPVPEAVRIAIEVCEVLRSAHSLSGQLDGKEFRGIVHGDIKPRNIRLTPGGGVKVLDFGIAKALSLSRRLTRNEFGSLPYSSPERLETGTVDVQSDLWALGVVLHEMLGGRLPFQAETTEKLDRTIRRRPAPPPLPDCPVPLRRIVEKLLAPRLEDRYDDAAALHADLVADREGRPTAADAEKDFRVLREPGVMSAGGVRSSDRVFSPDGAPAPDRAGKGSLNERDGSRPDDATGRALAPPGPGDAGEDTRATTAPATRPGAAGEDTRRTLAPHGPGGAGEDTRRTVAPREPGGVGEETRRTVGLTGPGAALPSPSGGTSAETTGTRVSGASSSTSSSPGREAPVPEARFRTSAAMARWRTLHPALRWTIRLTVVLAIVWTGLTLRDQWRIVGRARGLAADLAAARVARDDAFEEHRKLAQSAWTSLQVYPLWRELLASYTKAADAVIEEYRTSDAPLVREKNWRDAGAAVARALELSPQDRMMRARRALIDGHLARISLNGRRTERPQVKDAIRSFRDAAELADWGDPYLGLAALHAYVLHDVEKTDEAVQQIVARGLKAGRRERAQRGDARLRRATDMWASRGSIAKLPEEKPYLEKIRDHLSQAIELYGTILGFEDTHANLRKARGLLERVEKRLAEIDEESAPEVAPPEDMDETEPEDARPVSRAGADPHQGVSKTPAVGEVRSWTAELVPLWAGTYPPGDRSTRFVSSSLIAPGRDA